jgi:hypothetical protein
MAVKASEVKIGDKVKILSGGKFKGRIVELRGPLGPGGKQVFRILLRTKPSRAYVEVLEDQIELIPKA